MVDSVRTHVLFYDAATPNERAHRKNRVPDAGGLYREWILWKESLDGSERRVAGVPLQDAKSQ